MPRAAGRGFTKGWYGPFLLCHLPDVGLAVDSLRVGIRLFGVNGSQDRNLDLFIAAQ